MIKVQIVADLTFGDAGKGMMVDNLVAEATRPLVVRYTGGPQAAHTVMRNGKKHIFSSFGSGTLSGAPSYFSEHTLIHPSFMANEWEVLDTLGIQPKLYVHPLAAVITPYDVAWNRLVETSNRHGSCGKGIGATMRRHNESPYKLYAIDLFNRKSLNLKLDQIAGHYERTRRQNKLTRRFTDKVDTSEWLGDIEDYIDTIDPIFKLATWREVMSTKPGEWGTVIFEGAQGIMLDMDHGVFPHVTYGYTTTRNAWEMIMKCPAAIQPPVDIFYMSRCYQTRHGIGPMTLPEQDLGLINTEEEINKYNEWQQKFRTAELDYDLLDHAMVIDSSYHMAPTHKHLVLTCRDQRPEWEVDMEALPDDCTIMFNDSPEAGNLKRVLRREPMFVN